MIKIIVMMGLPGSGKSTYANQIYKSSNPMTTALITCDDYNTIPYRQEQKLHTDKWMYKYYNSRIKTFIIDGLITETNDILKIADAVKYIERHCQDKIQLVLHHWNEDRETCLKNDGGRRARSAYTAIKGMTYEAVIDKNKLQDQLSDIGVELKEIAEHTVELKPEWERIIYSHADVSNDMILRSCKWSTGGVCGNCYDSSVSYVEGEAPLDFEELDNFLMEICPDLNFVRYKKLVKDFVETETTSESGYYGGETTYMNWKCNLKDIYEKIQEWKTK